MTGWGLQDQLAEIIDMLLDRHPMGLRVLVGEAPPPTAEEIHLMYAAGRFSEDPGVRVDGGEHVTRAERMVTDEERFERIIDRAGGWKHITSIARAWEAHKPQTWLIVEDHVAWVTSGSFSRIGDAQLQRVALKYRISPETVQRYRREFPADLAKIVLRTRPRFELARAGSASGASDDYDAVLNGVLNPVLSRVVDGVLNGVDNG